MRGSKLGSSWQTAFLGLLGLNALRIRAQQPKRWQLRARVLSLQVSNTKKRVPLKTFALMVAMEKTT